MARRPRRHVVLVAALLLVAALGAAPSVALASATLTYPTNGVRVALDKKLTFDFRWTLPPGEEYPEVDVGTQPRFDLNNQLAPFDSWCGGDARIATSCRFQSDSGAIPTAGVHYAVVATSTAGSSSDTPNVSPEVRFSVPYRIGLGCAPTARCEWPKLANSWLRLGDASYPFPYTDFNIWAWTNGPKLTLGFVLRHGRHVVRRWRRTMTGNVLFDVPSPDHLEARIYHLPGIAAGTPLALSVVFESGNATFTHRYTTHAGGGPRHGVAPLVEGG